MAEPPTSDDLSVRREWTTKQEIQDICDILDDYPQFRWVASDVCLDPDDEDNNYLYSTFRTKSGGRLTRAVVDGDATLVGNDKAGLSAVLDIPVCPGATLSVQMSTWCNPCFGGYSVCKSQCFGVGMVPYETGTVQKWCREETQSCISNGVQYYAFLNMHRLMFGDMIENTCDIMEEGKRIRRTHRTLSLHAIDVCIRRDNAGGTEFTFEHGGNVTHVKRPADEDESVDLQLYFNCLSWPDNNTYVQIHKVVYDPPPSAMKKDEDKPPTGKEAGKKGENEEA